VEKTTPLESLAKNVARGIAVMNLQKQKTGNTAAKIGFSKEH
jgi:hypothetical protein